MMERHDETRDEKDETCERFHEKTIRQRPAPEWGLKPRRRLFHRTMANTVKAPPTSEITPESAYTDRRRFIKDAGLFAATAAGVGGGLLWATHSWRSRR